MNIFVDSSNFNNWCNKGGTSDRDPKTGNSWKDYYIQHSITGWPYQCRVSGCRHSAEVGAHMYRKWGWDGSEYIVPLCREHNNKHEMLMLKINTELVPANQSKV